MKKITLIMITALFLNSCITFKTVPNFVSSKELAALTIGTSKAQVKINLGNTSPYDILAGWSQDCEVHQYKYKKSCHKLSAKNQNLESGLSSGQLQYEKPEDAYLVYKNGKLSSLITDAGKKDLELLMDDVVGVKDACNEKGVAGCMDPESINYNKNAVVSDGSCKYVECGLKVNPNFNKKRPISECNLEFIPIKPKTANIEAEKKKECTNCDIIEGIASNPNANITISLGSNSNSLRNVFSPSKKKTTISLTESVGDQENNASSEIPEKKAKKQKSNEENAANKQKRDEENANREKPNLFKPN